MSRLRSVMSATVLLLAASLVAVPAAAITVGEATVERGDLISRSKIDSIGSFGWYLITRFTDERLHGAGNNGQPDDIA